MKAIKHVSLVIVLALVTSATHGAQGADVRSDSLDFIKARAESLLMPMETGQGLTKENYELLNALIKELNERGRKNQANELYYRQLMVQPAAKEKAFAPPEPSAPPMEVLQARPNPFAPSAPPMEVAQPEEPSAPPAKGEAFALKLSAPPAEEAQEEASAVLEESEKTVQPTVELTSSDTDQSQHYRLYIPEDIYTVELLKSEVNKALEKTREILKSMSKHPNFISQYKDILKGYLNLLTDLKQDDSVQKFLTEYDGLTRKFFGKSGIELNEIQNLDSQIGAIKEKINKIQNKIKEITTTRTIPDSTLTENLGLHKQVYNDLILGQQLTHLFQTF